MKAKTISTRWTDWTRTPGEFFWAKLSCITFGLSVIGLPIHLWFLSGVWRTVGLVMLIAFATVTQTVLVWRAKKVPTVWWWVWVHAYIVVGVLAFELASVICSSAWGF